MSRVVVEFKTDGAAFRPDEDTTILDTSEVAGLLRIVADRIAAGDRHRPVVDSWGNVVGAFTVEEGDPLVTRDGQANDCRHDSATGVDQTPVADAGKVWRCDHCGLRWRADGGAV